MPRLPAAKRCCRWWAIKRSYSITAATTPIVDMVRFSPAQLDAEALINLLRPLTPRLYSIASSQAEVENEVHVTVGVVRYDVEGRAPCRWCLQLPRGPRGRRGRSPRIYRT
ncbi:sulfite reductase (NADPH) flavoprotein alpha subunit [Escherichia coli]|uniref:Sulfite reductase (NADPH) flavoprotein alpha subunit n=1 Tax=Escherichia coli TaxID=562 RepID=A0A377D6X4_ECOLX|nr:sulfite reductase (NADPH) flavoprotein alpha subunit [Escherichia coli]